MFQNLCQNKFKNLFQNLFQIYVMIHASNSASNSVEISFYMIYEPTDRFLNINHNKGGWIGGLFTCNTYHDNSICNILWYDCRNWTDGCKDVTINILIWYASNCSKSIFASRSKSVFIQWPTSTKLKFTYNK